MHRYNVAIQGAYWAVRKVGAKGGQGRTLLLYRERDSALRVTERLNEAVADEIERREK